MKHNCVITRSTWARENAEKESILYDDNEGNKLLTEEGGKCCLGFWCEQVLGIPEEDLATEGSPSVFDIELLQKTLGVDIDYPSYYDEKCFNPLIQVNDRYNTPFKNFSDTEQEAKLIDLFAKLLNTKLTFID